ncbi:MAG TPA: ATP-binding cassette domain-containing protein [Alloprevotella sp.]|nr:ATP-binding cassette domain-containing protein [Alloprevotella sp.]
MQEIIKITQAVPSNEMFRMAAPVNFTLYDGEHIAVCGPNGGGKSLFVNILTGSLPLRSGMVEYAFSSRQPVADNICCLKLQDAGGAVASSYYQQRWNKWDDTFFPTVMEVLQQKAEGCKNGVRNAVEYWVDQLSARDLLYKTVNLLSSGESRKFQLLKCLLSAPSILVIDNPFIGLDSATRRTFVRLLERIKEQVSLFLIVSRAEDIPDFITHVLSVEKRIVGEKVPRQNFLEKGAFMSEIRLPESSVYRETEPVGLPIVECNGVTVRYDGFTILDRLDWTVRRGEHWALTGENGAGKSTLLSLVYADNPQAYACDIRMFGLRRGRGESIWDVKRRIGYVSPEMFNAFRRPSPALDIVVGGLRDSVGSYGTFSAEERKTAVEWMRCFRLEHLSHRNYMQLSDGERRMILLVRAFVKSPELLILDEPFQGLDSRQVSVAKAVIDEYMRQPDRTLIIVTHSLQDLPQCIDHTLHLSRNKQP